MEDKKEVFTGSVVWFNRGLGFLNWEKDGVKQKDMFVHYSDINADGFRMLYQGQLVSFEVGTNHRNQPKAINVKVIK